MDFELSAEGAAFRAEVRAFLAQHFTAEVEERLYNSGVSHDADFARAMGERGWLLPGVPRDGYPTLDAEQRHILQQELARADAPLIAAGTSAMVARVILAVGTDEMQQEIVPEVQRGGIIIALGMSEPEAGSDVATVQTKAVADDDGWRITGQKMFTTNAHIADYVFVLARTDPESERHHGLTTFLVPTDRHGFDAQAVFTLSGERTNITYFDSVFIEDRWRIGEVGRGWSALMLALQDEHSTGFSPHLDRFLSAVERSVEEPDARLRMAMVQTATELEVAHLLELRAAWMDAHGNTPVAEGPMAKLYSSEALVRATERLTAALGPDALRSRTDPTTIGDGHIEHSLRYSLGTTIYAGTSEVQRNLIAQFRCKLPRA